MSTEPEEFLDRVVAMVRARVNPEHPDCAVCDVVGNIAHDIEYMRREAREPLAETEVERGRDRS